MKRILFIACFTLSLLHFPTTIQKIEPQVKQPIMAALPPKADTTDPPVVASEVVTPTPVPSVKSVVVSGVGHQEPLRGNWDSLLQQYFGANWQYARKIMICESGGNARAVGPRDSQGYNPIGLFQIKNFAGRPSTEQLYIPEVNIAWAAKMTGGGVNWSAWQCK